MRIGLAQINTTTGDLAGNSAIILNACRALAARGAELIVFPELALTGCAPRDLLLLRNFVPANETAINALASQTGPVPAIIGFVMANPSAPGHRFFNAAAFCHNGAITAIARKSILPPSAAAGVFDETRYFDAASAAPCVVRHNGLRIALTIGQDLCAPLRPAASPSTAPDAPDIDLLVNISASPWHHGAGAAREQHLASVARAMRRPLVHLNAVGGNDELVHAGKSLVADARGNIVARCAAFGEDLRIVELQVAGCESPAGQSSKSPAPPAPPAPPPAPAAPRSEIQNPESGAGEADLHAALVLGLRDYARKSGFKRALVALSGGIDSALVAVLAAGALGAENVTGILLPSAISPSHSLADARRLAQNLGIRHETIPIAGAVAACEAALAPHFGGLPRDTTEENIQARVRGVLMMALSNKSGALLLTTGNKSEIATGYCTLYGDMCGGLAVISDVLKTQVYALARWINRHREIIPQNTIDKPPSAELRPGQADRDSLPPYDVLDSLIHARLVGGATSDGLLARGFDPAVVRDITRKIDLNEFKRRQAAPGLTISPRAFDSGRHMPIVHKYSE